MKKLKKIRNQQFSYFFNKIEFIFEFRSENSAKKQNFEENKLFLLFLVFFLNKLFREEEIRKNIEKRKKSNLFTIPSNLPKCQFSQFYQNQEFQNSLFIPQNMQEFQKNQEMPYFNGFLRTPQIADFQNFATFSTQNQNSRFLNFRTNIMRNSAYNQQNWGFPNYFSQNNFGGFF